MKTKIEEAKDLRYQIKNNRDFVQKCLGNKLVNGKYIRDSNNDKHDFIFSAISYRSSKPIYLNAYYGYYGDSSISMFNNDFYVSCLIKVLNKHISDIIKETEKIMQEEYNKTLLEAKREAEEIISMVKESELF